MDTLATWQKEPPTGPLPSSVFFCFISKFNQNLSAKSFVFSSHSKFLSQDSTLSQLFAKSKLFLPQPDHKSKAFFQTGFSIIFTSILTS